MGSRYTGPINSQRTIDRHAKESHPLQTWASTSTATSSFTATGLSLASAMTSTMGSEVFTLAVQPGSTSVVLDIDARLFVGATVGSAIQAGLFYGSASHTFDTIFHEINGTNVQYGLPFSLMSRYQPTSTATADIGVRLTNGSAVTTYFNSDSGGNNMAGQIKSFIRVTERR